MKRILRCTSLAISPFYNSESAFIPKVAVFSPMEDYDYDDEVVINTLETDEEPQLGALYHVTVEKVTN